MNFAIVGAGAYIAERHMRAIKHVSGAIVEAFDINDVNIGKLDKYNINCRYTPINSHSELHYGDDVDTVVICTPNATHAELAEEALLQGKDVICEKPLCLSYLEIALLKRAIRVSGKKLNVIQQLRNHPSTKRMMGDIGHCEYDVKVNYIAPRGDWYNCTWKGDVNISGGIIFNIGIHIIDILSMCLGSPSRNPEVIESSPNTLRLKCVFGISPVVMRLSTDKRLAQSRQILVDDGRQCTTYNFGGIDALHDIAYDEIMSGCGYGIEDAEVAIKFCETVSSIDGLEG